MFIVAIQISGILQHCRMEQGSNPTKAGGMSSVLRSFCLVLFVLFVVFLLYHVTSTIQRPAPPNRVKTAIIEDEEVGLEEIPDEQEADDGVELSEEITFLFAIINMNRTAHLGIDHYTFEKDYLQQMKNILKLYKKEKVQVNLRLALDGNDCGRYNSSKMCRS